MLGLVDLFSTTQVQIIVALIAIDVVLGVLGAVVAKEFRFGKLGGFLKGPVLGYVFGYGVLELVAEGIPSLAFLLPAAFLLIVLSLVASLFRNLNKLGLPLPGSEKV
ncbi:phage holin family protein [Patescibacteria group bacterium]|nr:phage holin family protein [Patescibacteria group bacterium]